MKLSSIFKILTFVLFLIITFISCKKNVSNFTEVNKSKIVNALNGLRLRSEPNLESNMIILIPNNATVMVVEESPNEIEITNRKGKWTKVKYDNKTGWVFGGFLQNIKNVSSQESENIQNTKIGKDLIEQPYQSIFNRFSHDSMDRLNNVVRFYKNNNIILSIHDKGKGDDLIRGITILSPEINVEGGLRVGMPIEKLLEKYQINLIYFDSESSEEYLSPTDIETFSENGTPIIAITLTVESNDGKPLAIDTAILDYPAKSFRRDGYISKISIFYWPSIH